jgi:cell division protein FtsQ
VTAAGRDTKPAPPAAPPAGPAAGPAAGRPVRPPRRALTRRRAVLAALVALTLVTGGTTWALYGSAWFRATQVRVNGAGVLTAAQIERAAVVPLGGPLLSVDTGAVRRRVLAALPRVRDVAVTRSWPHTVRVEVTERTASAVLAAPGGKFTEVDRDGVRFATAARAPRGVPLVQLTPVDSASLRHFGTRGLLRAAIEVSRDLPDSVRGRATTIRVRSYDGITVELSGGREVMWGSAEDGARKAEVLTALLKAQPEATRFDVSAPTAPAAAGS